MIPLLLALVLAAAGAPSDDAGGPPTGGPVVVALDPGHGGTNLGAAGGALGLYEKRVTLDIARRIARALASNPRVRVVLCRDGDVLVPVRARVRCANEAPADLFVSLHANASPQGESRGTQRGFELYVLPADVVDQEVALAAAGGRDDVDAAWRAFRARGLPARSLAAARRIQLELQDALGRGADRGIKQAGAALDVLQGLRMPGVLIEVGFIDHAEDVVRLASEEGRELIAGALAKALGDWAARELRGRNDPSVTAAGTAKPTAAALGPATPKPRTGPVRPRRRVAAP